MVKAKTVERGGNGQTPEDLRLISSELRITG